MRLPVVERELCLDCPARPGNNAHADLLEEAAGFLRAWRTDPYEWDIDTGVSASEVASWLARYEQLPKASYAEALGVKDESKG